MAREQGSVKRTRSSAADEPPRRAGADASSAEAGDTDARGPLELDRRIHEPGRLGILSALAGAGEAMTFSDLARLLSMSDGNLVTHLRTLEEAGWVEPRRVRQGARRRHTLYAMTRPGATAFTDYLDALERIIERARG